MIDGRLGRVIRQCVAKKPAHRPSAAELSQRLDKLQAGTPEVRPGGWAESWTGASNASVVRPREHGRPASHINRSCA